jgi:hypothetical protein
MHHHTRVGSRERQGNTCQSRCTDAISYEWTEPCQPQNFLARSTSSFPKEESTHWVTVTLSSRLKERCCQSGFEPQSRSFKGAGGKRDAVDLEATGLESQVGRGGALVLARRHPENAPQKRAMGKAADGGTRSQVGLTSGLPPVPLPLPIRKAALGPGG